MEINKQFSFIVIICGLTGFFSVVQALTLDNINHSILPGDQIQLSIDLSGPIQEEPLSFSIDNPARIALDFPGTSLGAVKKSQPVGIGVVNSIFAVEAAGRTRVVINLVESVPYHVDIKGSSVLVTLGGDAVAMASTTRTKNDSNADKVYTAKSRSELENIDFRRGDDGEGKVLVTLSDPSISVDMKKVGDKIVLDFIGVALPSELDRKLDVVDFATPIKEIDLQRNNNGAQMQLSTVTQEYDYLAYQLGNQFIIEVRSLDKSNQDSTKGKSGFTGERLSLNFQDIEVRAVLQLIADFTGLNMVASDTVSGNVTLRLKNVPWDQALDIILRSKGLGLRKIDNVIMVAPNAEIAAREKLELEASKQVDELAPLRTEFIQVNYAKASELAKLMKAEANNLLSARGSVTIDERTNTLIVQDVPASLKSIREMLLKLDIPVRQVLIEARIVNASQSFVKDLGARFGYSKNTKKGSTENTEGSPLIVFGGTNDGFLAGTEGTSIDTGSGEGLLVDLAAVPGNAAAASLVVGKIGSYLLQLELSALIADGKVEDIASPKIITANQRQARIESGVEIPFQEASASGATTTAFKQAVLALDVTPQITPDDRVLLDLNVSQDTPGVAVIGGIPINTRRVQTQVLVDNGETVVLGGVYTSLDNKAANRVPFFSELPYVGFLFKQSTTRKTKSELLIFVTPKILKDSIKI